MMGFYCWIPELRSAAWTLLASDGRKKTKQKTINHFVCLLDCVTADDISASRLHRCVSNENKICMIGFILRILYLLACNMQTFHPPTPT